ncbi:MAG: hypothetical protein HQK96_08505 [Nitrospirae bacterium]|nr:hypothetical protein [Nitrospirota bacterium]MBF0554578.1 hypothetical protein [Nitrospirota bacterium]
MKSKAFIKNYLFKYTIMPIKTTKPSLDTFIGQAKAENKPTKTEEPLEDEELFRKDKSFLLRLPMKLWERAKDQAAKERLSLHDYILLAIKEKNMRYT